MCLDENCKLITILEDGDKKLFIHYSVNDDGEHQILSKDGDLELLDLLHQDGLKFEETITQPTIHYKVIERVIDSKNNLVDIEVE